MARADVKLPSSHTMQEEALREHLIPEVERASVGRGAGPAVPGATLTVSNRKAYLMFFER